MPIVKLMGRDTAMSGPNADEVTAQSFWDQRFADADDYLFGRGPNAFLARQKAHLKAGESALAIADGEGRNSVWLAQQGLTVTAMDFSAVALEKSRALAAEAGVSVTLQQADIFNWDWPSAAYDVIAGIFFQFAAPAQRADIFSGIRKAVKPGGLILLEGYRPAQVDYGTGGPPQRENMYTEALLREHFGDFDILTLDSYDAEVDEGPGHKGKSALIDLVARRPVA